MIHVIVIFFFFNDTATTEIYTLSLHDALPILPAREPSSSAVMRSSPWPPSNTTSSPSATSSSAPKTQASMVTRDRKSTRLNSSHANISYAVFCLKKKKKQKLSYLEIYRISDNP